MPEGNYENLMSEIKSSEAVSENPRVGSSIPPLGTSKKHCHIKCLSNIMGQAFFHWCPAPV